MRVVDTVDWLNGVTNVVNNNCLFSYYLHEPIQLDNKQLTSVWSLHCQLFPLMRRLQLKDTIGKTKDIKQFDLMLQLIKLVLFKRLKRKLSGILKDIRPFI